jgi:hypothetical protein
MPPEILKYAKCGIKSKAPKVQCSRNIPVGLFVFDESHNMRSGAGGRRFQKLLSNWRMANPQMPRTLLVTATPINNQFTDLTNQVNSWRLGGEVVKLGKFYDQTTSDGMIQLKNGCRLITT